MLYISTRQNKGNATKQNQRLNSAFLLPISSRNIETRFSMRLAIAEALVAKVTAWSNRDEAELKAFFQISLAET